MIFIQQIWIDFESLKNSLGINSSFLLDIQTTNYKVSIQFYLIIRLKLSFKNSFITNHMYVLAYVVTSLAPC